MSHNDTISINIKHQTTNNPPAKSLFVKMSRDRYNEIYNMKREEALSIIPNRRHLPRSKDLQDIRVKLDYKLFGDPENSQPAKTKYDTYKAYLYRIYVKHVEYPQPYSNQSLTVNKMHLKLEKLGVKHPSLKEYRDRGVKRKTGDEYIKSPISGRPILRNGRIASKLKKIGII